MTAFNVVNRAAMAAGQPEDISVVLANLDAIATVLNGGVDNSNINAAAAIAASKFAGYPADVTKVLRGDGSWASVIGAPATTLPASPSDAQVAVLVDSLATPTYAWMLQWSATASKWIFVGGVPAQTYVDTAESLVDAAGATTYAALTTAGPSFTVPRAGDYLVEVGSRITLIIDNGTAVQALHSFDTGGTGAIDADAAIAKAFSVTTLQQGGASTSVLRKKTGLVASAALVSKYKMSGHTVGQVPTPTFANRWMRVTPIAVT